MVMERLYSVRVDGFEIRQITLSKEDWGTQAAREEVRKGIAATYKISTRGMRLVQIDNPHIYVTDMKTGETKRRSIE